jgi:hypothetical protein
MQPGQAGYPIADPLASQHAPISGHDAHVMVALGPVDSDQQHRQLLLSTFASGLEEAAAT